MADSTEARIAVREWTTGIDGYSCVWTADRYEQLQTKVLVAEHNAVVSQLRAALATIEMHKLNVAALGERIGVLCDEQDATEADRDRLREALGGLLSPDGLSVYGTPDKIAKARTALQGASLARPDARKADDGIVALLVEAREWLVDVNADWVNKEATQEKANNLSLRIDHALERISQQRPERK